MLDQVLALAEGAERDTLRRLGILHRDHLDDTERARDYFELAVDESADPLAIDALLSDSEAVETDERRAELLELKLGFVEDDNERAAVLRQLMGVKHAQGDIDGAILAAEGVREANADDGTMIQELARLYQAAGRVTEAKEMLGELVVLLEKERRHRELVDCLFTLGTIAEESGERVEATNHFGVVLNSMQQSSYVVALRPNSR